MRDWLEWHRGYDDAEGPLARRLALVQQQIAAALDAMPPGPIRVISLCAGEGRDLLGVVGEHPRGSDVTGVLVELDPQLAARARAAAPGAIEVRCADASTTSAYAGAVPADLVLVCGVFGNIGVTDIGRTVANLPSLCAPGATVIWTRHRRPPDRTAFAREAFAAAGFAEVAFIAPAHFLFGVGVHRLHAAPSRFETGVKLFEFAGYDALDEACRECGFVYNLSRPEVVDRLRADGAAFTERMMALDDDAQRARPALDVWSPLEYACHVRDMLRVQHDRVELMQREHEPQLTPMGRDERVIADQYNEQDPAVVAAAVTDAARSLAAGLEALDDAGWRRTARYNYPTEQVRDVEWIGVHTVHELQHHRGDLTRRPDAPAR